MHKLFRVTAAAGALALSVSLAPQAQAAPTPLPELSTVDSQVTAAAASSINIQRRYSAVQMKAFNYWGYMRYYAVTPGGSTLDYKKAIAWSNDKDAKRYGGSNTTAWRRQFTAGAYGAGITVINISAQEKKLSLAYLPRDSRTQVRPGVIVPLSPPDCSGERKIENIAEDSNTLTTDQYLDSCQTDNMQYRAGSIGVTCGFVASSGFFKKLKNLKPVKIVQSIARGCAAASTATVAGIEYIKRQSPTKSVIIRSTTPKGNYTNPQNLGGAATVVLMNLRPQK